MGSIGSRDFDLTPATCTKDFAAPPWRINGSTDSKVVNLHVVMKKVVVKIGEPFHINLSVPMVANLCKITKGDELVIKKDEPAKAAAVKRTLAFKPAVKAKAKCSK